MKRNPTGTLIGALFGGAATVLILASCSEENRESKGFVLPAGDSEAGRVAFSELKCTQCHSVAGVEFPEIKAGTGQVIGGEVRKVKTYGELVTSVINPKHHVAESYAAKQDVPDGKEPTTPMPTFNSVMTVKQLCDLVTFLHSRYRETGPEFPDYPMMMP